MYRKKCFIHAVILTVLLMTTVRSARALELDGIVYDGKNQPVPGVRIRVQGRAHFVLTDRNGRFHLSEPTDPQTARVVVAAGKKGWINNGVVVTNATTFTTLYIERVPDVDDPDYTFITPQKSLVDLRLDKERLDAMRANAHTGFQESCNLCHFNPGCYLCHQSIYEQWNGSHHANAVKNGWTQNLYTGTDVHGNEDVGPGYRLDYPDEPGECADCHAPSAAVKAPGRTDLKVIYQRGVVYPAIVGYKTFERAELEKKAGSVQAEGVHCDFCHKIKDVVVNDKAGVHGSIELTRLKINDPQREKEGRLPPMFVYGPFDDVVSFSPVSPKAITSPMAASYNPIFKASEYCSACHQHANDHGIVVQGTYQEWKESDYPEANIQCQDCHMKGRNYEGGNVVDGDADKFWTPYQDRDPSTIRDHTFLGGHETLVKNSATLAIEAAAGAGVLTVKVGVKNVNAGHYLPSGIAIRNVLLLVTPVTAQGDTLEYIGDQRVPDYGGTGSPAKGNYAGYPGRGFALVYGDAAGHRNAMDWQAVTVVEDTRLRPKKTDTSVYRFALPRDAGEIEIQTQLIYRRAYKPLADAKGWKLDDIPVQSDRTTITPRTRMGDASKTERRTGLRYRLASLMQALF